MVMQSEKFQWRLKIYMHLDGGRDLIIGNVFVQKPNLQYMKVETELWALLPFATH